MPQTICRQLTRAGILLLMLSLLAGCATDRQRTMAEGTGVGAGVGAALGAITGALIGGERGALIGAAAGAGIGAAAGAIYANHVANQKEKFASQEDYLDAVIQEAQQVNEDTRRYNAELAQHVVALDQRSATLEKAYRERRVRKSALTQERRKIEQELGKADEQLKRVTVEIQIQEEVLVNEQDASRAQLAEMQNEINQLKANKAELEGQIQHLASLKQRVSV